MEDLSNNHTDNFPVSFHVFGIGESFKPIIDKIGAFGYDDVSATTIKPEQLPSPTEEDRMVIIWTSEGNDSVINAAKIYYQAGVLTLIVSHQQLESQCKFCVAQLVADNEAMHLSVKAILDMIFNNGLNRRILDGNGWINCLSIAAIEVMSRLTSKKVSRLR